MVNAQMNISQREKTEKILENIIPENGNLEFYKDHVKSTPVKENGKNILDIYYRKDGIRINIDPNSIQYTIYKRLYAEGIAYQKTTADPNSTSGVFAFFVKEENVTTALRALLKLSD